MGFILRVPPPSSPPPARSVDWARVKRDVIHALGPDGVIRAFGDLGVRFSGQLNPGTGKAQCHAMDRPDDSPSAFINIKTGVYHAHGEAKETLNLYDFAVRYGGAKFGDWLAALKHFADQVGLGDELKGVRKDHKGRVQEGLYDYTDDSGKLVYQVIRFRLPSGKKDFTQRQPDGKGGWINSIEGIPRVLYRLPEVLADPDALVLVLEGEKDVDRLYEEAGPGSGLVATTNSEGAKPSSTVRWDELRESLRGRSVVVIPDNDPPHLPGRAHARGIAERLHGVASSVKLAPPLPGVGPKGDLSDFLDIGHTLDDLRGFLGGLEEFDPVTAPEPEADDRVFPDLSDLKSIVDAQSYLWKGWIPNQVLVAIASEPGTGKTRFAMDLCRRAWFGLPWPDGQPPTLPPGTGSLWVQADQIFGQMQEAAEGFGLPPEAVMMTGTLDEPISGLDMDQSGFLDDLTKRIKAAQVRPKGPKIGFLVIDTVGMTTDRNLSKPEEAKAYFSPLIALAIECNLPVLCLTHLNLAGKAIGRRIVEKARVVISMDDPDPVDGIERRRLRVTKTAALRPPALGITMTTQGNEYDLDPPLPPGESGGKMGKPGKASPTLDKAREWLKEELKFGRRRIMELIEKWEESGENRKALYRVRDEGTICREEKTEGRTWWLLVEPDPAAPPF
jgi:hypothetical protein